MSTTAAFAPGCAGVASAGTLYVESEVEPHVAVHPRDPLRLVGAWQQNRWSNGSAQGLLAAYSIDGGTTWAVSTPRFSRCTGGTVANGGDYERATDPWVSIGPDGVVHLMALATRGGSFTAGSANAMLAARSVDGGRNWSDARTLILDGSSAFNDKNALTADPLDARYVYAVWDRISGGRGPTWFARSTDGGLSWEAARPIHDPGANAQTIGNVVAVVTAGAQQGTVVNLFTEIVGSARPVLRVQRSTDRGINWSSPITINEIQAVGARDPQTGVAIRDGSILAQIAAAPNGDLIVVWQDARFSSGQVDAVVFARSVDGGLTWSAVQRLSPQQPATAFTPQVAVRSDGTIAVTYYDLRSNTTDAATLPAELWLATSSDLGSTWREQRVSGPFDLALAPNANGLFLGDYIGLVASGSAFVPFFVQTNGSTENRTDVYATRLVPAVATARVAASQHEISDFGAQVRRNVEQQLRWRQELRDQSTDGPERRP